jgi:hypothetical protein
LGHGSNRCVRCGVEREREANAMNREGDGSITWEREEWRGQVHREMGIEEEKKETKMTFPSSPVTTWKINTVCIAR